MIAPLPDPTAPDPKAILPLKAGANDNVTQTDRAEQSEGSPSDGSPSDGSVAVDHPQVSSGPHASGEELMTSLTAVDWINRKKHGLTAVVRLDQIDGDAAALLRRKIWIDHHRYFVMAVESIGLVWPGKVDDEVALTVRALL